MSNSSKSESSGAPLLPTALSIPSAPSAAPTSVTDAVIAAKTPVAAAPATKKPLRQQEVHDLSSLEALAREKADGMYEVIVSQPWMRPGEGHGITCMNLPESRKFTVGKIAHQFGWDHNKQAFANHLRSLGVAIEKSDKSSHPQGFVTSDGVYIYMKSIGWSDEQCRLALLQLDPFFGLSDEAKKKAVEELKKKRRELQAEERKRKREEAAAVAAAAPPVYCVDTDVNDDDNDDNDGAASGLVPMVVEVRAEEEPANSNAPKRARTQADAEAELEELRKAVAQAGNLLLNAATKYSQKF